MLQGNRQRRMSLNDKENTQFLFSFFHALHNWSWNTTFHASQTEFFISTNFINLKPPYTYTFFFFSIFFGQVLSKNTMLSDAKNDFLISIFFYVFNSMHLSILILSNKWQIPINKIQIISTIYSHNLKLN